MLMVAESVFGLHEHLSGEYSSVFYSQYHSLLGNCSFSLCCIFLLSLTSFIPISRSTPVCLCCSHLLPVIDVQLYCRTYKGVHLRLCNDAGQITHTHLRTQMQNYAKAHLKSLNVCIQALHEHIQMSAQIEIGRMVSFLHSNTLRKCKATLPISGKLLRAGDFLKERERERKNFCVQ